MGILLSFNLLFSSVSYAKEDMTEREQYLNEYASDSASEGTDAFTDPVKNEELKERSEDESGSSSSEKSSEGSSEASTDNSASEDASLEDESDEASSEDSVETILDEELTEEAAEESSDAASLLLSGDEKLLENDSKLLGASADPYSGSCGVSASWKFDPETGVLTISGSGAMDDYEIDNPRSYSPTTTAPWFQYTKKIKDVVISDDITYIGAASFVNLSSKRNEFRLPSKLKGLGNSAFWGFDIVNSSPRLIIPGTVTDIPDFCFYEARVHFGEIVLEEGIKSVGNHSFESAGYSIVLPESLTTIGVDAFKYASCPQTYTIPKGIKKIGKGGFYHLQYVKVLIFEGDMPQMDEDAFGYNSVIAYYNPKNKGFSDAEREKASQYFDDVTWKPVGTPLSKKAGDNIIWSYDEKSKTLRFDGYGAMYDYSASNLPDWYHYAHQVEKWYFDPRITEIGDYCFYYMGDFRAGIARGNNNPVIFPPKLKRIGKYGFSQNVFYNVTMAQEVEKIDERAFLHTSLSAMDKTIVFPKKVKYIGDYAFYESGLRDAFIDLSSIEYIGEKALDFRSDTKNVTSNFAFPDSLKYIGDNPFDLIRSTTDTLRLPAGVTYIGENAFYGLGFTGEVVYPSSATVVKRGAFSKTTIDSIIFSNNLKTVEFGAFGSMKSLKKLTFAGAFPNFDEAFFKDNSSKLTIYYPFDDETWYEGIKGLKYNSEIVEFVPTGNSTTVTFIDFNGKVLSTQTVTPNAKLKAPSVTTLNGKKVGGWYTSKNLHYQATRWNFDTPVKNKITLYAGEEYSGYRVVFYPNNGKAPIIQDVKKGDRAKEVTVERDDYRFIGWYEKGSDFKFNFERPLKNDVTLYARWEEFRPYVTYKSNGYDYIMTHVVAFNIGDNFWEGSDWTKAYDCDEYAQFLGWYLDEKLTKPVPQNYIVTKDLTVYGKWKVATHKVTFVYGNGMKDVVVEVPHGNDLSMPEEPLVTGYYFKGWYLDPEKTQKVSFNKIRFVSEDTFVYALFEAKEITVVFKLYYDDNKYSGSFSTIKAGESIKDAFGKIDEDYFPPEGYDIDGWYLDKNFKKKISEETKLYDDYTEIYGKLIKKAYNITFDPANGETPYTIKVEQGKRPEVKNPVRKGYEFIGWLRDGSTYLSNNIPNAYADAKYTAQWQEIQIKVSIDVISADGKTTHYYEYVKTGATVSDAIAKLKTLHIPSEQEIEGWYSDQKCTKLIQKDTPLYENVTIYVKLRIKTVKLSVSGLSDMPYTGKAVTLPNLKVTDNKYELVNGKDYTVNYSNNVNAGVATITITYKGNYKGKNVLNFNILKGNIKNLKNKGTITSSFNENVLPYNKRVQKVKPAITFVSGGTKMILKENRDYKLVFEGTDKNATGYDPDAFKEPGKYTIKVEGIGSFEGSFDLYEIITADKLVGKLTVTGLKKSYSYTGDEIKPFFTVKDGRNEIGRYDENGFSSDYLTCKIDSNKNLGTATIELTAKKDSGYAGSRTLTFSITGTPLSSAVFDGFATSMDYDGTAKKQNAILYKSAAYKKTRDDAGKLQYKKDYDVKYENNTEVGTATVIYTGMNGYYGMVKKTFIIKGKDLRRAKVTGIVNSPYTGSEIKQTGLLITDPVSGEPLLGIEENKYKGLSSSKQRTYDYIVNYSSNINKGIAKVTIKGVNLYSGTVTKTFNITARNISVDGKLTRDSYEATYTKKGCRPTDIFVVANIDGKEMPLTEGTDYKVTVANNKKAGSDATLTVTGIGNYTGKLVKTYKVNPSSISQFNAVVEGPAYRNSVGNFVCKVSLYDADWAKLTQGVDYKVTYTKGNQVLDPKKDKLAKGDSYTYKIEGINNYSGSGRKHTGTVTFDGAVHKNGEYNPPKAISTCKITIKDHICTGKAITPEYDNIFVTDKSGKRYTSDSFEIVRVDNNVNVGTATIVLKGKSDLTGQISVKFRILPKPVNEKTK